MRHPNACDQGLLPTNKLEFKRYACMDAFAPVLQQVEQSSPHHAVVVGDSIAAALGNTTLPNVAVGGDTTSDLERVLPLVKHVATGEAWVLIGVNDLLQHASAHCVHQRISALAQHIRPMQTHVLTLLPVSEGSEFPRLDDYCCLYRRISRLNQLLRADRRLRVHGCWDAPFWDEKRTRHLMKSDGLHPNQAGRRLLRRRFQGLVAEYSAAHGASEKPTCIGPPSPLPPAPLACANSPPCHEAAHRGTRSAAKHALGTTRPRLGELLEKYVPRALGPAARLVKRAKQMPSVMSARALKWNSSVLFRSLRRTPRALSTVER